MGVSLLDYAGAGYSGSPGKKSKKSSGVNLMDYAPANTSKTTIYDRPWEYERESKFKSMTAPESFVTPDYATEGYKPDWAQDGYVSTETTDKAANDQITGWYNDLEAYRTKTHDQWVDYVNAAYDDVKYYRGLYNYKPNKTNDGYLQAAIAAAQEAERAYQESGAAYEAAANAYNKTAKSYSDFYNRAHPEIGWTQDIGSVDASTGEYKLKYSPDELRAQADEAAKSGQTEKAAFLRKKAFDSMDFSDEEAYQKLHDEMQARAHKADVDYISDNAMAILSDAEVGIGQSMTTPTSVEKQELWYLEAAHQSWLNRKKEEYYASFKSPEEFDSRIKEVDAELTEIDKRIDDSKSAKSDAAKAATAAGNPFYNFDDTQLKADRERKKELQHEREQLALHRDNFAGASMWDGWNEDAKKAYRDYQSFYDFYQSNPNADTKADMESALTRVQKLTGLSADALEKNRQGLKLMTEQAFASDLEAQKRAFAQEHPEAARWGGSVVDNAFGVIASADLLGQYLLKSVGAQDYIDTNNQTQTIANSSQWVQDEISKGLANGTMSKNLIGVSAKDVQDRVGLGAGYAKFMYETKAPEFLGQGNLAQVTAGWESSAIDNTVRNVLTLASMCGAAAFADAAGEMTAKMIWDTARSGSYSELAGKVTGLMMGGKVFASEAKRLLDQGVPSDRAVVAAGISAAIEGISEKYNIEAMLGEGATMGKPAWQRLAIAALFEGTEELESNWMSPIASWAETGELNSRIELTYKDLVSQGADPKDALTAAYMSVIDDDIASFTAGAFSALLPGVISSGTRGTISTFQNKNSKEYKAARATIKTSLEATLNESKWHNEQYGVTEDTGEVASYINRHGQVSIIDSNGEYIIKRVPRLGDAKVEKTTCKDFSKARDAAAEIIMNKMGGQNAAIAAAARDRESFVTGRQERDFNEIMLTQDEVSQQIAKLAETPFARKSDRFNMEESIKASAAVAAVESGRRRLNDADLLAVVKALRLDKSPAMQNFMADRYRIATGSYVSGPITADNALSILREMNDAAVQTYEAQHRAGQLRMSEDAIAKSEKSFRAMKALKDFRSRAAEKSAQVGDMLNAAVDDITKQDAAKAAERTNGDTTTVNGETMTKSEFMANAEMQALAEDSGISMDDLYKAFHDSVVMVESSVDYDSLTEIQLASMDMLELLGEKFGLRFHMYDSSKFAEGEKRYGKNGFYTSGGDIYIDVNAGTDGKATILYTATHEMLHFIKANSPALYTEIAAWIREYGIPDDASFTELMNAERDLQLAIGIDVAKEEEADPTFIEEEVIADALSEALTSKRAQDLLSNLSDLSSEAGKAMSDQFAATAEKVRELYKGVKPSTKAGRYMEQMATSINEVSEMFVKALKEVAALKDSDRSETAETTNATTDANTPTTDANTSNTEANTSNTDATADATADATSETDVTTSQEDADFNYEMSGYESYVRGLMNAMTPAAANEILRNPNYADAWESLSGEKLVGSNNQKRDQIMKGQIRNEWLRFSLKDDVQTAEESKLDYDLEAINEALYRRIEDGSAGGDDDDYATAFHDLELRALKLDPAIEERQDELSAQYTNEEAFLDSDTFARFSIRPPYSDNSKDFARFRSELNDDARQTMDLFYNVFKSAQLTNAKSLTGAAVKNINIAATYMTVDAWNDMLSKDKQWSDGAKSIVRSILQTEGLLDNGETYSDSQVQEAAENSKFMRNMRLNWDGSLNPDALEQNFGEEGKQLQLSTSLMQRLVDSLPLERIDATYTMLGDGKDHADKTITLPAGRARQSVGGEAYRRAITNETRKAYFKGKLKPVSISAMHKDRWGSLGFLAENGKTGASGDLTTLCPQMMYNRGCFYCYRRASMETGVNNKLVARSVWYTGEILRLKDSDVKRLNKMGGLRIQSFGDWMPQFSAQMADILYDAELRGLQVKIITKEPSMIEYIAALREQGIGLNLYFNLSADYVIEKAPKANNKSGESLAHINPARPYYRDESGQMWWKRAFTVEEADVYRRKYPWVNCRIVATTQEQFIRGLKDPRVDVVTGYHGKLRSGEQVEHIDSTIGDEEGKRVLMIEPMGDAGMPRFTYDQMSQEWVLAYPGKTKTHQALAAAIQKEGLEAEYVAKTCCLTGRCASCIGLCGKTGQSFISRNATNRDAEGTAWWVEHLTYADESIMDETDVPATWMDHLTSLTEDGNEKMLRWFDDAERKLADLARNQQVQVAQDGVSSAEAAIKKAQNAVRKAEKKYKESPTEENRAKLDEKRQALAQRQSELPEAQTALADVEKWNADTAATRTSLRDTDDEDRNDERYAELAKNPDKNHRALQNMVRAAAEAAGFTIHGYHGTPAFGFTQFDPNRYVFITEDEGIAMGYSRNGYPARRRDVASAYVDDDGTDDTLIRNAKNVLGVDLTTSTPEKVDATLSDLRSRLLEGQRELDELGVLDIDLPENMTDREQEAFWNVAGFQGEVADQLTDVLAATEDREWREENLEQQIQHYYSDAVLEENRDVLMDYYGRNQQMLRDRGLDKAFSQVIFGVNASYNRIDVASVLVPLITNPSNTLITEDGKRVYDKTELRGRIEQAKGAGSYELFGNPGDNPLVVDAEGHMWDAISYDGKYWTTDKLAAWAQENGYTSVTVKNVRDSLLNLTENRPQTEHIFFNNDQVKSADPVTYDESGSVIPLSERFNSNQTDIRYSIRDDADIVEQDDTGSTNTPNIESKVSRTWKAKLQETPEWQKFAENYATRFGDDALREDYGTVDQINRMAARMKRNAEMSEKRKNEAVAGRKLAEAALKAAQAEARAKDVEQRRQAAFRAKQDQKTEAAWVRDAQGYEDRLASLEKSGQRKTEDYERRLQATREHDKLMAERKMYRVLFHRSLVEQRRRDAEVKAAGKRSIANYKVLHARGVLESRSELNARRNRDTYDYDPNNAEFNTLRKIEGEAAATGMDKVRKIAQDIKAKAVSMALGFEKSLVNSLQYLDKFDRMQGAAGMEGSTVSVLTKAAAVYNSTVQTNLHDHLVNPDGDIVGDSFSDTFLCWNEDHTAIDREQQAVLQDIMLNLDNISRQSAVSTAWSMLQQFEEKNAWLTHVTNQEFAELVASQQEREDIAARDRQLKKDLSNTKSIAEAERLQKQYDADVKEIQSRYEKNHLAQEYAKLMRNYRNAKKSSASKVIFTDSNGKAITAESSQKVIESYRQSNPDLFQKVDAIQAWWDQFMRDWAVGVSISEDEYEIMRQMRPYYAPTHRIGKGVGGAASAQGTGLSTQKQVKGLTGSDRQIMNLEDQFYEMMQSIVRAKRLNDVYGSIVNTALDNPDGAFTGVAEYDYDYDEGQTDLLYDPEDIVDTQISEDLLNDGNGYTVTYWENGQRHRAYINQDLYESLFNLADKHTGSKAEKLVDTLTKAGNTLTSPMKAMITGTNPLFAIRNVMRDIPTAYINSVAGLRFGKYWTQALKELHHSENWDHFAALGGEQMGYYRNENAHKQNTDNLLKYFEKEANPSLMKKFGDKWTYLAEASESVTRFAEYLATLDLLGGDTTENRLQGIKNAAEVTVDFSRRGTAGSLINAWVPYWNPAVQGVSKVVRSVIGDDRTWQGVAKQAGTTLTKALVVSAGPEILMYLLRHMVGKDKDYEELSDYVKDNYFCIPMAGNTWFKIPKNREWAALLGTPLNRILQGLDGRSDIWEGYVEDNLEANFLPGTMSVKGTGIPDPLGLTNAIGVSQMLDLLDNTNFAGSPIVSAQFKDYSTGEWASNQYIYDKNTSLVAYGMARLLGDKLSPIQMDYIMQSYMGDFYSMLNGLVDMGLVDGEGTVSENVVDAMRDVRNSWVVDSRYSNSTTASYYSAMDDLTKQITDLRVQSNGDEYKDSIEYRTKQALTKLGKNLSALSKQARDMQDGREKDAVKGQVVQAAGELLDFYDRCMAGDIEDPETYAELYDYSGTVRDGLMQFSREQLTTAKVMPATSAPTSYADERRKGYTYYLNSDQREVYMDLYSQAYDDAVRNLLGSSRYRAANDEGKLDMLSDIKSAVREETTKNFKRWLVSVGAMSEPTRK